MITVSGIYENGHITLLTPLPQKKAKVIVTVIDDDETVSSEDMSQQHRIPGLHKGAYFMAEDFDAPLPDTFWLGEA